MHAPKSSRRQILVGIGAICVEQSICATAPVKADSAVISPGEEALASDLEARLDKAVAEKHVWNLHSVVVMRHGHLVLERYFEGDDYARGSPLGNVTFKPDTLHDLRSASKSIVGLLYGITLGREGATAGCRCLPYFPNIPISPPTPPAIVDHTRCTDNDHGDGLG